MTDTPNQTAKSPSWLAGYQSGKSGSSIIMHPIDWGDFHVGFAIGLRDRRNDEIMDDLERAGQE